MVVSLGDGDVLGVCARGFARGSFLCLQALSGLPEMRIVVCFDAYSIIKLVSFPSTFVGRFSGLGGDLFLIIFSPTPTRSAHFTAALMKGIRMRFCSALRRKVRWAITAGGRGYVRSPITYCPPEEARLLFRISPGRGPRTSAMGDAGVPDQRML